MKDLLIQKLQELYGDVSELSPVSGWRTNLNFFVTLQNEEYFLRTSASHVQDPLFWGKLEKEAKILEILGPLWVTPKLKKFFQDEEISFLLMEKSKGIIDTVFEPCPNHIYDILHTLHSISPTTLPFLETISIFEDYRKIISQRALNVRQETHIHIIEMCFDYLFHQKHSFWEELVLCHNDFRSDNILRYGEQSTLIDVEWMWISDVYLDLCEYYVGGVFWQTFGNQNAYNYSLFSELMEGFWSHDDLKNRYLFLLKFVSNFSWLASHIHLSWNNIDNYYKETMLRNEGAFKRDIKKLFF